MDIQGFAVVNLKWDGVINDNNHSRLSTFSSFWSFISVCTPDGLLWTARTETGQRHQARGMLYTSYTETYSHTHWDSSSRLVATGKYVTWPHSWYMSLSLSLTFSTQTLDAAGKYPGSFLGNRYVHADELCLVHAAFGNGKGPNKGPRAGAACGMGDCGRGCGPRGRIWALIVGREVMLSCRHRLLSDETYFD
jgi:hypothetical protein